MATAPNQKNNAFAGAAFKLIGFVALVIAVYYAADFAAYTVMSAVGN